MKDTYYHKGMRKKLVAQLKEKGIKDEKVLKAIESIPRHFFLDKAFEELAYEDQALPIGSEQTISQPYTVAFQTELLEVKTGDRILEIGTGSGYQACILAALGANVFSIERQEALYLKTTQFLKNLGIKNIKMILGDGHKGLVQKAPFDKIIITAGANEIPEPLKEQLVIGGIMIVPIGEKTQQMYRIARVSETEFYAQVYGEFRFVPFTKGINRKQG